VTTADAAARIRALEAELEDLRRRLAAAEELRAHDEKLRALGQLISGVAHELANPLTAVAARAALIRTTATLESARAQARVIEAQAERATGIVRNLSSFARRRRDERAACSLNDVVRGVLEIHGYQLEASAIEVVEDLEADAALVEVDRHQIEQVVLNLVLNAQHAMAEAHGQGSLTLRTRTEGDVVRLDVEDTGPGIPADALPQIFKPFFSSKGEGGSGLGLAICQELVRRHAGTIRVHTSGAGTTITIELPRATVAAGARGPAAAGGIVERPKGAVLVVDDDGDIGELIAAVVRSFGYDAEHVRSAMDALERVRGRPFWAVVADLRMPGMDGADLWRVLAREQPVLARRTIFMTGDHAEPDTAARLEATAQPFLAKPFRWEELDEALATIGRADVEVEL
jgi:nitrogen-specific signal transduction histidine kinase/CheY-like chemotaxis protein